MSIITDMSDRSYWRDHWKKATLPAPNNFAKRAFKLLLKRHKTLLDLGCGDGRDALYFARKGLRVTALDFSESGMNAIRARDKSIRCMLSDIRTMKFKRNAFDVIYAHLSLHYFDDGTTRKIFDKLFRILRKGGLLFVKCKSTDDALFGKGKKLGENMYRKGHARHFFNRDYMREQLKRFNILSIRKTSSIYHTYKSAYIEAVAKK